MNAIEELQYPTGIYKTKSPLYAPTKNSETKTGKLCPTANHCLLTGIILFRNNAPSSQWGTGKGEGLGSEVQGLPSMPGLGSIHTVGIVTVINNLIGSEVAQWERTFACLCQRRKCLPQPF